MLKKRGNTDTQIARALSRDRKTVKRALLQTADKTFSREKRVSLVDCYEVDILLWISEQIPVAVMLERVRKDSTNPYQGGKSIFYQRVRLIRQELKHTQECYVVGGTWQQFYNLAVRDNKVKNSTKDNPQARWFDLVLIDEASQVKVAQAAGYFLLLRESAHVVLAGDNKQLGPVYGFQMPDDAEGLYDCVFTYMQKKHGIDLVALTHNYRSNEPLTGFSMTAPKKALHSTSLTKVYQSPTSCLLFTHVKCANIRTTVLIDCSPILSSSSNSASAS